MSVSTPLPLPAVEKPADGEDHRAHGQRVLDPRLEKLGGLSQVLDVLTDPLVPAIHAALAELREHRVPFDLRIRQLDQPVGVLAGHGVDKLVDQFYGPQLHRYPRARSGSGKRLPSLRRTEPPRAGSAATARANSRMLSR